MNINLLLNSEDVWPLDQTNELLLQTSKNTWSLDQANVPIDILLNIFKHLSITDLINTSQTCRAWKNLSEHTWQVCHSKNTLIKLKTELEVELEKEIRNDSRLKTLWMSVAKLLMNYPDLCVKINVATKEQIVMKLAQVYEMLPIDIAHELEKWLKTTKTDCYAIQNILWEIGYQLFDYDDEYACHLLFLLKGIHVSSEMRIQWQSDQQEFWKDVIKKLHDKQISPEIMSELIKFFSINQSIKHLDCIKLAIEKISELPSDSQVSQYISLFKGVSTNLAFTFDDSLVAEVEFNEAQEKYASLFKTITLSIEKLIKEEKWDAARRIVEQADLQNKQKEVLQEKIDVAYACQISKQAWLNDQKEQKINEEQERIKRNFEEWEAKQNKKLRLEDNMNIQTNISSKSFLTEEEFFDENFISSDEEE